MITVVISMIATFTVLYFNIHINKINKSFILWCIDIVVCRRELLFFLSIFYFCSMEANKFCMQLLSISDGFIFYMYVQSRIVFKFNQMAIVVAAAAAVAQIYHMAPLS